MLHTPTHVPVLLFSWVVKPQSTSARPHLEALEDYNLLQCQTVFVYLSLRHLTYHLMFPVSCFGMLRNPHVCTSLFLLRRSEINTKTGCDTSETGEVL